MFVTREREKNGRYSYHSFEDSKHEIKKKKFFKEKNVSPKEKHTSLVEKCMNYPSRRKMPPRFVIPHLVSLGQE